MKNRFNFNIVGKSLHKLNGHVCSPSIISFSLQNEFQFTPFENLVLGGNRKLWIKIFYMIKFSLPWK